MEEPRVTCGSLLAFASLQPEAVINRIIYDCVLPPVSIHAQGQAADANDKQGASMAGFPSVVAGAPPNALIQHLPCLYASNPFVWVYSPMH
eukprot:1161696-Pelagomonas_calceolata.AAC.23